MVVKYIKYISVALMILTLFTITSVAQASNLSKKAILIETDELPVISEKLTDGVYNIINKQTGKYIDVYSLQEDADGSAILNEGNGGDSQSFLIKLRDDGTYSFYPQNDRGEHALYYSQNIMEREIITKTDKLTPYTEFKLNCVSGNEYIISPAFTTDTDIVMGVSSITTYLGHNYVGLAVYTGDSSQKWEFVKVGSTTLSVSTSFVTVRTGGSARLYGITQPSYLSATLEWSSANEEIATVDSNGVVHGVSPGKTTIRVRSGEMTSETTVSVTDVEAFAWYSQHNINGGGWFASSVANLYLTSSSGVRKMFFVEGPNRSLDWMDEGCKIACIAMVLRNMDAKLEKGYDVRTGENDNLAADPFTVVLANTQSDGLNLTTRTLNGSPVVAAYATISSRFTVNGSAIESSIKNNVSKSTIKNMLDSHPEGVIVGFRNYARNIAHYLVFTKCINPDANPNNYEFLVCDPVASNPADGNNVNFTDSYSYNVIGYRYSNIVDAQVYNVIE